MDWLRSCGESLYGQRWQAPLARELGRSRNHVIRCASGERPLPERDIERLIVILVERQAALARLESEAP